MEQSTNSFPTMDLPPFSRASAKISSTAASSLTQMKMMSDFDIASSAVGDTVILHAEIESRRSVARFSVRLKTSRGVDRLPFSARLRHML